jgi:hypothetical protein
MQGCGKVSSEIAGIGEDIWVGGSAMVELPILLFFKSRVNSKL